MERSSNGPLPSASVPGPEPSAVLDADRRRVSYLMLIRLILISAVLGSTLLLSWAADVDLAAPVSLVLFGLIGVTYLLTIIYALLLRRTSAPLRLASYQLAIDLFITAVLVHVTGGAQSAFSFFFPISIIGAATVRFRRGALAIALASMAMFLFVSLLGWFHLLPVPTGQRLLPHEISSIEFGRALALNLAAIAGVGVLAVRLGGQLQRTSASLQSQRVAAADLFTIHADIVRSLASGLVTIDNDELVVSANQVACDILGVSGVGVAGGTIDAFLPGLGALLSESGPGGSIRRADLEVPHADGSPLFLGISVSPMRDNRDVVIGRVINFQDLTELRALEEQMKRSERMAAIGALAAGIAHEIRNPLASISGSIELLSESPLASDDDRSLMEIVTREVDRLNALLTDLLDYSNPQPRQLVEFDLCEMCRETIRVFERDRTWEDRKIAMEGGDQPLRAIADPNKIRQVIWNLLRNAAEAVAKRSSSESEITLRVGRNSSEAVVKVSDNGPGIPQPNLERVFDPFFTTKVRGTGFGLATCHSILTEHGGRIEVESAPDKGTTFTIYLPQRPTRRGTSESEYTAAHE